MTGGYCCCGFIWSPVREDRVDGCEGSPPVDAKYADTQVVRQALGEDISN